MKETMDGRSAKLLILADDFTGALDAGVQFVGSGARIKVLSDIEINRACECIDEVDVLVLQTNSRHVDPQIAHDTIYRICKDVCGREGMPLLIYKKTDSALRGRIGAELDAVLHGGGYDVLFFVPAYPKLNRITRDGIHFIDGVPVNESAFAADPLNPVRVSYLPDVIHQYTNCPVEVVLEQQNLTELNLTPGCVYVFDATTDERLRDVAEWMRGVKIPYAAAGCAGFATYVADLFSFPKRERKVAIQDASPLVVLGSLHTLTMQQMKNGQSNGYEVIPVMDFQGFKNDRNYRALQPDLDRIIGLYRRGKKLILMTNEPTPQWQTGGEDDVAWKEEASIIAGNFGKLIEGLILAGFTGVFAISGGDTLYGVLKSLGCTSVEPLEEIEYGVVLARVSTRYGERYIVTKSGGMGSENVFCKIASYLRQKAGLGEEIQ